MISISPCHPEYCGLHLLVLGRIDMFRKPAFWNNALPKSSQKGTEFLSQTK